MIPPTFILLLGLLISIGLAAFFAGSESGFLALNRLKIEKDARLGDSKAIILDNLIGKSKKMLGATLVGTNLSVVSATVLANMILVRYFSLEVAQLLTTFGLTFFLLIFAEIIPKSIFHRKADILLPKLSKLMKWIYMLFLPIVYFVNGFSAIILFLTGNSNKFEKGVLSRDDIEILGNIAVSEGVINSNAKAYIHSVFLFGKTSAREIMTPLVDIVAVEAGKSLNSVVKVIDQSGFSRMPIFSKKAYNMVGYINSLDIIHSKKRDPMKKFLIDPVFVPETKVIDDLLIEMRTGKIPLVFVVDEWGGTAGIITNEDIAEFVVGNVRDAGEKLKKEIIEERAGVYLIDPGTDVDDLREELCLGLKKDGFETVGGFVEFLMQKIPKKGDSVKFENYKIVVEDATDTVIKELKFIRQKKKKEK